MKKRICCLIVLLLTIGSVEASAASCTLVVNTGSTSKSVSAGAQSALLAQRMPGDELTEDGAISRPMNWYTDETSGETVQMNELIFPDKPGEDCGVELAAVHTPAVGETDVVALAGNVKCIYVGAHCSIWQRIDDKEAVRMTKSAAKQLAENFDAHYDEMQSAFGKVTNYGKFDRLAVYCYDIDSEYPTPMENVPFTAGFFNDKSCIHIDTYPLMGRIDCLWQLVERSYGTLIHEYQHLISDYYCDDMPTYLDEAFSMAAEHLTLGAQATKTRVDYFSTDPRYEPGSSLNNWGGNLSSYANSYLFGQYLRTRYGQQTETNGNAFFGKVIQSGKRDKLAYIADLFSTTKSQLLCDFWTAVCLKESSGPYGFAGEEWANAINMRMETDVSSGSRVGAGGARLYAPGVGVSTQLTTVSLADCGETPYYRFAGRTGTELTLSVYTPRGDTLYLALYDAQGRMLTCRQQRVSHLPLERTVTFDTLPDHSSYRVFLTDQGRPLPIEKR